MILSVSGMVLEETLKKSTWAGSWKICQVWLENKKAERTVYRQTETTWNIGENLGREGEERRLKKPEKEDGDWLTKGFLYLFL